MRSRAAQRARRVARWGGMGLAVSAAVGAGLGALIGWIGATGEATWNDMDTGSGVGGAVGGVVWLAIWGVSRAIAGPVELGELPHRDGLLGEFRRYSQGLVRSQWRVLLDGGDRLPAPFEGYRRIAPPRAFHGSLRHRSDLAGALDAAAASGGAPRLLVIGRPGYGKTVALLDIAQHLSDDHGGRFGTPVIFSLGSYRREDGDLETWMVRDLCDAAGPLPAADQVVTTWVTDGTIAPILDGLDEIVDGGTRQACVAAINRFIDRAPPTTAVVVASRPAAYTAISEPRARRLAVNAGIELQRLAPSVVARHLTEVATNDEVRGLAELARSTPAHPAARLLRVPLWLRVAGALGQDQAKDLRAATDSRHARQILTDAQLERLIATLDDDVSLGVDRCRRALAAIAGFLADPRSPDSTTLSLEDLTPRRPPRTLSRVVKTVAFALTGGLLGGLAFPLVGMLNGLAFGLAIGANYGIRVDLHGDDGRPYRSRFRWPGLRTAIGVGLGAAFGLVAARAAGVRYPFVSGAAFAVLGGLIGGFLERRAYGLMTIEAAITAPVDDRLDAGRRTSRATVVFVTAASGLALGLGAMAAGLLVGPPTAILLGVAYALGGGLSGLLLIGPEIGGWYLFMQHRVRRLAVREDLLPRDPVPFLVAAADAGILRRTGAGLQFRHRTLADRLAEGAPTPGLADLRLQVGTDEPAGPTPAAPRP